MKAFLRHSIKPVNTIRSFRDKTSGWRSKGYRYALKTENTDGTESNYGFDNCVLLAFGSHMGNRYSCNDCKFARFHRMADLTIADLWGDTEYPEQHYRGGICRYRAYDSWPESIGKSEARNKACKSVE